MLKLDTRAEFEHLSKWLYSPKELSHLIETHELKHLIETDNLKIKVSHTFWPHGKPSTSQRLKLEKAGNPFNVASHRYSDDEYSKLNREQYTTPVALFRERGKQWWMFHHKFYSDNENLTAAEVRALVLEKEQKQKRRVERAMASVQQQEARRPDAKHRKPIPDSVKMFVWQRDNGHCVKCGSQRNLEFDHIIPIALGGSNTARNVQLLCEPCNRSKGSSIG